MGPILRKLDRWRYHRNIDRAVALHFRGGVTNDGLHLIEVSNHLEIKWRARDVHPWDADLPTESRERRFRQQLLEDTEAAIFRLFKRLPQIDQIDLGVLDPASDTVILAGVVERSALDTVRGLVSVRMRLHQLGVSIVALGI
jgi:hypothetical protein